jgi:hypothetical protein
MYRARPMTTGMNPCYLWVALKYKIKIIEELDLGCVVRVLIEPEVHHKPKVQTTVV